MWNSLSTAGQIEFRALVFIPSTMPFELTRDMFSPEGRAMRLYVKRVFINDKFEDGVHGRGETRSASCVTWCLMLPHALIMVHLQFGNVCATGDCPGEWTGTRDNDTKVAIKMRVAHS